MKHQRKKYTFSILFLFWMAWLFVTPAAFAASTLADRFALGWQAYEAGQFNEAFRIWESLAEQGDPRAQVNLGIMYDNGDGVPEKPDLAAKWYLAAAKQENCGAQYNLAAMYASGRGVPLDMKKAACWYQKAAQQNFAAAQHDLGMLYATGTGVPPNKDLAIQWLYKAGLGYLKENKEAEVLTAADAINNLAPDHALAVELKAKIQPAKFETRVKPSPGIFEGASLGTAWPIASCYVVTCNHVVSDTDKATLVTVSGREIPASIILRDEANDIALLKVAGTGKLPPALPLSESHARLGAEVFTIGFPRIDVMGKTPKLSVGVISAVNGLYDDPGSYQTTVPIQPGNSGGPVLNMNGEVVGVVSSMLGIRDTASGNISMLQNTSCVAKIDSVHNLLARLHDGTHAIDQHPHTLENLENLAEKIQGSVLIVVAR
ncbi:MAG: trypsin-like peptidase domain-containing protein [Deltaproteobacteria bacterium]|nr:trypsin-like peptidase domain-containing protein [Deltaproteobacteria bacterium]